MTQHGRGETLLGAFHRSPYLSTKHTGYFAVYETLFEQFRGKAPVFIEIGILNGGSLFMWRDYLGPDARIIGIDLNPDAKRWEKDGFEIFIGSQSDPDFWSDVFANVGEVDVVLDDGGHTFEQQIITCDACLPHIRDGGLMVVEDAHTSYMPKFGGSSSTSFMSFARNIVDGINYRSGEIDAPRFEETIFSVSFFESVVAFQIDRELAKEKTSRIQNSGESMDAPDFRMSDTRISQMSASIEKLFRRGSLPYRLLQAGKRQADKLSLRMKNAKLRRFFRF